MRFNYKRDVVATGWVGDSNGRRWMTKEPSGPWRAYLGRLRVPYRWALRMEEWLR